MRSPLRIIGSRLAVFHGNSAETLDSGVGPSGREVLESGEVFDEPINTLVWALPEEFRSFRFSLHGLRTQGPGAGGLFPIAALSYDGGTTYIHDTTNFDSYLNQGAEAVFTYPSGTTGSSFFGYGDAFADLAGNVTPWDYSPNSVLPIDIEGVIMPGDEVNWPRIHYRMTASDATSERMSTISGFTWANGALATVPYPAARATNILFQPWGDGILFDPAWQINQLKYELLGVF